MFKRNYNNFVRPTTENSYGNGTTITLSGNEARQLYLDEFKQKGLSPHYVTCLDSAKETAASSHASSHRERQTKCLKISDKDLFLSVQNDDVDTLNLALDACPDSVNKLDEYGWSLLMIACQANSIQSTKELIKRGIDTSVRDKAGNSAQSLVIKNRNYELANILLSNKPKEIKKTIKKKHEKHGKIEDFFCEHCNVKVNNKESHLSSTIHNINLCKGKKLPANYVIPESNRGYQIMVKVGWDKESGLGPDGSGNKYPIKTVQKQDRKGLGHNKRPLEADQETESVKHKHRKKSAKDRDLYRNMEINFRRQFY